MEFSQTYMQRERAARKAKMMNVIGNTLGLLLGGVLVAGVVLIKVTQ